MSKIIKQFADDGWAIWIDGDDRSTVYINEWINPGEKNHVDIGIRVYGARQAKDINIYIPFQISRTDMTDLSEKLSDTVVFRSIFNTNGFVDTRINDYFSELKYGGHEVCLISLTDDCVSVRRAGAGTLVTVDLSIVRPDMALDEAYVIFRIPHRTLDRFFSQKTGIQRFKKLITSPVVTNNYRYSIRINEARLLPEEINQIKALQEQKLRKILITVTIDEAYELNDSGCHRIRRLDSQLKRSYVPDGFPVENAITYEWVEQRSENMNAHYSFYFNIAYNHIGKLSILLYVLIIASIGVLGCALYDLIKTLISFII